MKMATKRNETEYMYSSARARSLENRIASAERLAHMADADSSAAIIANLSDLGFEVINDEKGEFCRESTLATLLVEGYAEAEKMVSDSEFFNFLRYQYDCHNIKAMIKCFFRGVSCEDMLIPLGSVDLGTLAEAYKDKNYSCLPENMAIAAREAEDAFAATSNPQKVDLILDKACYADMRRNVEDSRIPLAIKLVKTKIDLTNLLSTVRLSMMKLGASAESFLGEVLIEGGYVEIAFWLEGFAAGIGKLAERLEFSGYSSLCSYVLGDISLGELEKAADNLWLGIAKEAKYIPFGPEVLIGYLIALEYEVKNIRILLAGKDTDLSRDVIRERLRESYV